MRYVLINAHCGSPDSSSGSPATISVRPTHIVQYCYCTGDSGDIFHQGFYRIIFSENYAKSVRSLGFNINNTSGARHKQRGGWVNSFKENVYFFTSH